jgi:hypothetical protein
VEGEDLPGGIEQARAGLLPAFLAGESGHFC